ncbi:MarR family transcriptional regulator [Clostridium sp. 19966]|uniref:MarR family winged helix-turn-helix transcriptional regulator n=1 Tax=Clostridium sp. 19966 TaxID=2768166 RepID=UPI0028DF59DC|nr:MarR family transcriptional regulator [Clostridium sp. 19966]MDT8716874.1 MarR family transcriptional regulator [Clostridium sp. 19966]
MREEEHIGRLISIFSHRIHRRISNGAAEYGLTGVQGRILGFLGHNSDKRDIFQKDIEGELNIRRSSVTSVLQLMEKNGYIQRISVSKDARLKKIILTDKGREIDEMVYKRIVEFEEFLRAQLTDDEAKIFIELINRLSEKIAD